jgi:16S rRNA (uracil1498-N3)-methyltransferase
MSLLWVHVEALQRLASSEVVSLTPDEARHVVSRRLRVGDAVVAFDGEGWTAPARIAALSRRSVEIEVGEQTLARRLETGFGLATAIPKGERLSTMLPMLIQLGLETWQPLVLAESSVRKLDVASPRLRRIGIEGCKVARRPWRMQIPPPQGLDEALAERAGRTPIFFGDQGGDPVAEGCRSGDEGSWVFIGPEAGFTEAERARLEAAGARPRCLGPYNLRIETAAVAATAAVLVAAGVAGSRGSAGGA